VNGGFESPVISADSPYYQNFPTGSDVGGWTVSGGDVDLVVAPYPVRSGNQALDLNGCSAGQISQTFDTIAGATYDIVYWVNSNGGHDWNFTATGAINISGDGHYTGSNPLAHQSVDGWEQWGPQNMVSSGGPVTVTLTSLDQNTCGGVILDDMTVTHTNSPSTVAYKGASQGVYTNKGTTVVQQAQVTSDDPACIAGRTVTFTINGVTQTAVTDASGVASSKYDVSSWAPGTYPVSLTLDASNDGSCQGDTDTDGSWIYKASKK